MSNTNTSFLKEMGITAWHSRDSSGHLEISETPVEQMSKPVDLSAANIPARYQWCFFGDQAQGDAQLLFQNIARLLELAPHEWLWVNPTDKWDLLSRINPNLPTVAIAFGGAAAQKITGERDSLPQLRETVLSLNGEGLEDIPVLATFDLPHLLSRPKDKALLWQDLLLAKSVLLNL
jgi:DNA polymerase